MKNESLFSPKIQSTVELSLELNSNILSQESRPNIL